MKINKSWLAVRLERITKTSRALHTLGAWAVAVALLFTAIPSLAGQAPLDGGSPGPYQIGHTSFVIKADNSSRFVAVDVYYPVDASRITAESAEAVYAAFPYENNSPITTSSQWEAFGYDRAYESPVPATGPFPLIVFGSALGGPGWGYVYVGTRLASHGFIAAVAESYKDGIWGSGQNDWLSQKLYYRPRDLSSALTEMLRRNVTEGDLLHNTIDRRYVVAAGHSLGGYAAFTELCGDDQVCDSSTAYAGQKNPASSICQPTPPDPRFTALLTLEGSSQCLLWEELSRVRVPTLIMGDAGNADGYYIATDGPSFLTYLARPHAAICSQARAVRVDITGADHLSFWDAFDGLTLLHNAALISDDTFDTRAWWRPGVISGTDVLPIRESHRLITKYVVAWLRAEVLRDGTELSQRILTQAYARAHEPNVEVYWDEGCSTGGTIPPGTFSYWTNMMSGACAVGDKNPAVFFVPYP